MVEMGLVEPRGANSIPFRYNGCTLLSLSQGTIGAGSICSPRNVGIGRDTCLVSLMGASFEQRGLPCVRQPCRSPQLAKQGVRR